MSSYVKNLIINDVKDVEYPIYQASKKTEETFKETRNSEKKGELIKADNLKDFLNDL